MTVPTLLASHTGMNLVRGLGRLVFGLLVFGYLTIQLGDGDDLWRMVPAVLLVAFVLLHALSAWRGGLFAEAGGIALDLLAVSIAVLLDPAPIAPTYFLFLVVILGGGLLQGPTRFLLLSALSAAIVSLLFLLKTNEHSASQLFLLTVMAATVVWFGLLLYRAGVTVRQAQDAAWRDPETGLISREAMVASAGWMMPLHDRLGASMTVAVLQPAHPGALCSLSDNLARRLRRSDLAARYDNDSIAVVLPCTTQTAAENLLTDLRQAGNRFQVAVLNISDAERSLEMLLAHLQTQLARATDEDAHWLVHAAPPAASAT